MLTMKEFRNTLVEMMERKGASPKVREAFLESLAAHEASIECARQRDILAAAIACALGNRSAWRAGWTIRRDELVTPLANAMREAGLEGLLRAAPAPEPREGRGTKA